MTVYYVLVHILFFGWLFCFQNMIIWGIRNVIIVALSCELMQLWLYYRTLLTQLSYIFHVSSVTELPTQ